MLKYQKEIDRLERAYNPHFNTLWNMVSKAKFALMKRFFETIASRVKHVYDIANRDVESWLKAVMSPLETQVREHHLQLRRRLESIKRIHRASGELEERIAELEQQDEALAAQIAALERRGRGDRRDRRCSRTRCRWPPTPRPRPQPRGGAGAGLARRAPAVRLRRHQPLVLRQQLVRASRRSPD